MKRKKEGVRKDDKVEMSVEELVDLCELNEKLIRSLRARMAM
jgi:hypothetical protein